MRFNRMRSGAPLTDATVDKAEPLLVACSSIRAATSVTNVSPISTSWPLVTVGVEIIAGRKWMMVSSRKIPFHCCSARCRTRVLTDDVGGRSRPMLIVIFMTQWLVVVHLALRLSCTNDRNDMTSFNDRPRERKRETFSSLIRSSLFSVKNRKACSLFDDPAHS